MHGFFLVLEQFTPAYAFHIPVRGLLFIIPPKVKKRLKKRKYTVERNFRRAESPVSRRPLLHLLQ